MPENEAHTETHRAQTVVKPTRRANRAHFFVSPGRRPSFFLQKQSL